MMSAIRTAAAMIGVAMTVARHPLVRAAVRAAPHVVTPQARARAKDATLEAAFQAGKLARKIVKRG
jgi:hypothetical protein